MRRLFQHYRRGIRVRFDVGLTGRFPAALILGSLAILGGSFLGAIHTLGGGYYIIP